MDWKLILEISRKNARNKIEKNFNSSYEVLLQKIDENTGSQNADCKIEKCHKRIEELVKENNMLKEKVQVLESHLEEQEQYSRKIFEIHGILQDKNEDVVKEVGKALRMDITRPMIDTCHLWLS